MEIKFSRNWNNKLNNTVFTTIRKYTTIKYGYYSEQVGKVFDVVLMDTAILKATLVDISMFYDCAELPYGLLAVDTGITERKEMKPLLEKFGIDDEVIVLTFETVRGE